MIDLIYINICYAFFTLVSIYKFIMQKAIEDLEDKLKK